jgi:hypothetical protein
MSYAILYAMLYARTYDIQVKTYDVVYDENIQCRTSDLRYRMHILHRMLRCRMCLTYDIDIRCPTCTTYDIVRVRCRTCTTYDIVCNIGIIRCRTSDVRHRTSARIQMQYVPFARSCPGVLLYYYRIPDVYIPGIYQVYTAYRNIHGIYVVYTYYIPRRGSRWL